MCQGSEGSETEETRTKTTHNHMTDSDTCVTLFTFTRPIALPACADCASAMCLCVRVPRLRPWPSRGGTSLLSPLPPAAWPASRLEAVATAA